MWASPPGGLYVSLLVEAHRNDLPGPLTAAVACACAEAIETVSEGVSCAIKWPNDIWVGRRKLAGLLLESASGRGLVVVGFGMNLRRVPRDLPPLVREATTALDVETGRATSRHALLEALFGHVDARVSALRVPAGRAELEVAWRSRLAFLGEPITYVCGGEERRGILEDASFEQGLKVGQTGAKGVWLRAEHVRELRPMA